MRPRRLVGPFHVRKSKRRAQGLHPGTRNKYSICPLDQKSANNSRLPRLSCMPFAPHSPLFRSLIRPHSYLGCCRPLRWCPTRTRTRPHELAGAAADAQGPPSRRQHGHALGPGYPDNALLPPPTRTRTRTNTQIPLTPLNLPPHNTPVLSPLLLVPLHLGGWQPPLLTLLSVV